jgi:hypothetical protein
MPRRTRNRARSAGEKSPVATALRYFLRFLAWMLLHCRHSCSRPVPREALARYFEGSNQLLHPLHQ